MKKLSNGWFVPDSDKRVTVLLDKDEPMYNPSYEQKYRQAVIDHLPNKRTFIDVGANVGIWSLPMSEHFSKIISYEPSKQNIECLKVNSPKKVEIREKAVANFNGAAEFSQAEKNCGDSKLVKNGLTPISYMVNVVRLDDENLSEVDMVKIDTQGWELDVLKGMNDIIKNQRPWVMIEINEDVDHCCKIMEDFDYETICLKSKRNFLWAPREGLNSPEDKSIFGRFLGSGPYAERYGG